MIDNTAMNNQCY